MQTKLLFCCYSPQTKVIREMMLYFLMRHYSYNAIKRDEGCLLVILLMLMVFNAEVLC